MMEINSEVNDMSKIEAEGGLPTWDAEPQGPVAPWDASLASEHIYPAGDRSGDKADNTPQATVDGAIEAPTDDVPSPPAGPGSDQQAEGAGPSDRLSRLAIDIRAHVSVDDDRSITLGRMLLDSRRHFNKGKIGNRDWNRWLKESEINLRSTRIRELLRVAMAADPRMEHRKQKDQNNGRQRKHREAKRVASVPNVERIIDESPLAPERERLIAWATNAPLNDVEVILAEIDKLHHGMPELPGSPDRRSKQPTQVSAESTAELTIDETSNDNIESCSCETNNSLPANVPSSTDGLEVAS
jgi:hypothetical protein